MEIDFNKNPVLQLTQQGTGLPIIPISDENFVTKNFNFNDIVRNLLNKNFSAIAYIFLDY